MAIIDEFVLKKYWSWWRYGISRHCDEWKYIIIGRIFESEIILIPPSLKISDSSSNTDEVWWRYGISRSCDECVPSSYLVRITIAPIGTTFGLRKVGYYKTIEIISLYFDPINKALKLGNIICIIFRLEIIFFVFNTMNGNDR